MSDWFRTLLACPDCARDLDLASERCACGFAIPSSKPLDLRPQNPRTRTLEFTVGTTARADLSSINVDRPAITYDGPRAQRDSSELFSAIASAMKPGAAVLDLGCGPRDQAPPVAHYGAQYVGVDYDSPAADLLADAHALPFRTQSFDVVISYAVFEHLYNPHLAATEVARVLKDGGVFVGVVSQGEPFHESFFHHTALGVLEMLRKGGLQPLRLWPSHDTLHALATMGRYPKPQRLMIEIVHRAGEAMPFLAPRKFFRWSPRDKAVDAIHRAASIGFVAEK